MGENEFNKTSLIIYENDTIIKQKKPKRIKPTSLPTLYHTWKLHIRYNFSIPCAR